MCMPDFQTKFVWNRRRFSYFIYLIFKLANDSNSVLFSPVFRLYLRLVLARKRATSVRQNHFHGSGKR